MTPDATTEEGLRELFLQHGSWKKVGDALGLGASTIRARVNKFNGLDITRLRQEYLDGLRAITSDDPAEWGDIQELLRSRNLNPDDWVVVRCRVNQWADYQQLRVDLEPTAGMVIPARVEGWLAPPVKPRQRAQGEPELVAFFGDHHVPFHDVDLHGAVLAWLAEHKPDRAIILGDLLDFDAVSRHRKTPEWSSTLQDTIDQGYGLLRSYIQASPNTAWSMLDGNHEDRLRKAVLDYLFATYGLRRAQPDANDRPVLSVPFLLRLDELGVDWIEGDSGSYESGQVNVTSELAARHGWIATKGSGASALKTIDHLRYSVIVGHTHRQSIVFHTAHSIDGDPRTLLGCEAGTLATVRGGLSYVQAPDWQAGFATATIWPGGQFNVQLAQWVDSMLLWRDWSYQSEEAV